LDWINAQVKERKDLRINFPQKLWKTGETFFYGGQNISLILTASETKKPFIRFMSVSFEYFFPRSWLELDTKTLEKNLHVGFLKFFKERSTFDLNERVNFWSEKMSLYPSSVSYRNQRTRWGSCSSKGSVNINWKLACFNKAIQDYVVIHELSHLKHQDHSKRFWNLVKVYCPNYKVESKKLDKEAFKVDCFLPKSELYDQNPKISESLERLRNL
jgi:predicted metal-dependent hydrolase